MPALRRLLALVALLLVFAGGSAWADPTFPKFTGLVVDDANVLPPDVEAGLTRKLEALQKDTRRQLVVATIGDMQGYPLEEYGYRLGRAWGVGLKDVNNGAILFIAPNNPPGQRGPRLEVGRGLEPVLTDALSSTIINQRMVPLLKQGQIAQAMEAGTDAIVEQLRASPDEAKARTDAAIAEFDRQHARRGGSGGGFPIALVFGGMVLLFVLLSFARRGQGRRYHDDSGIGSVVLWSIANEIARNAGNSRSSGWGGGGFGGGDGGSSGGWGGGGFTGGGGGDFGGGGASGDW
ncbi:uncharacterized protein GGQ80_000398 [Sphingomonas jinjuensis]|uniref:TPM domain-containing protein n=1 Tax=Sphingomonas jinjuensis TaxID=535907 RepID=A0A840F7G3_9SPHN|nr:TPM domain-containing protein [Sphingomonas jinjuensis]MBB4152522.1 uncharacterized protein [Sphingomonas jinjuensis]